MRTAVGIVILVLSLIGTPAAQAQTDWLITAGAGWGPLTLGMSEDDAIHAIGKQPKKRDDSSALVHYVTYDTVILKFFYPPTPPSGSQALSGLDEIDIQNPLSSTREGIRVGASLFDVIKTYGDSGENHHYLQEQSRIVACLAIDVTNEFPSSPNHRSGLVLSYLDRGIEFEFYGIDDPAKKPGEISVDWIDVVRSEDRGQCPSAF